MMLPKPPKNKTKMIPQPKLKKTKKELDEDNKENFFQRSNKLQPQNRQFGKDITNSSLNNNDKPKIGLLTKRNSFSLKEPVKQNVFIKKIPSASQLKKNYSSKNSKISVSSIEKKPIATSSTISNSLKAKSSRISSGLRNSVNVVSGFNYGSFQRKKKDNVTINTLSISQNKELFHFKPNSIRNSSSDAHNIFSDININNININTHFGSSHTNRQSDLHQSIVKNDSNSHFNVNKESHPYTGSATSQSGSNKDSNAKHHNQNATNSSVTDEVAYFDESITSDRSNVQIPSEYLNAIYHNLLLEENSLSEPQAEYNYMKKQKEVNEQMRSILVDWIIDVHLKFGFTDETLYMTVSIIDRYLTVNEISRSKLQLLGITAMMIACKHEEIDLPKVDDFIYITDNAYTKDEVFKMENAVLSLLKFNLLSPSPIKFFELLANGFKFNNKQLMMGKYLMESFLIDIKSIKYKASSISCACAYIVMKFFKMSNYQESYNKKYYSLQEEGNEHAIKECAKDICLFVDNIHKTNFVSTQKKFTKSKFEKVALLILGK